MCAYLNEKLMISIKLLLVEILIKKDINFELKPLYINSELILHKEQALFKPDTALKGKKFSPFVNAFYIYSLSCRCLFGVICGMVLAYTCTY